MTRKHYKMIAEYINLMVDDGETYTKAQLVGIVANALRGTNPRYNSTRFYNYCLQGAPKSKKRAKRTNTKCDGIPPTQDRSN